MKQLSFLLAFVGMALISQQGMGQEFSYVPPGLDFGYRTGINLGNGVVFGYGIGVGVNGTQKAVPVYGPTFQSEGFQNNLTLQPFLPQAVASPNSKIDKQKKLEARLEKEQRRAERLAKARDDARARNERYLEYIERKRVAAK